MPDAAREARIALILAGRWREYLDLVPTWEERILESMGPGNYGKARRLPPGRG